MLRWFRVFQSLCAVGFVCNKNRVIHFNSSNNNKRTSVIIIYVYQKPLGIATPNTDHEKLKLKAHSIVYIIWKKFIYEAKSMIYKIN